MRSGSRGGQLAKSTVRRPAVRFLSQPALSKQIKQPEGQLGATLFIRSRHGLALTAAGEALASRTSAVLAEKEEALRETEAAAGSRPRPS